MWHRETFVPGKGVPRESYILHLSLYIYFFQHRSVAKEICNSFIRKGVFFCLKGTGLLLK